ncbi:MAG: hypothetical protein ACLFVR_01940 [Thiohalospira sp.]
MKIFNPKKTIVKKLFIRVIIVIIILNTFLAFITIRDTVRIQQKSENTLRQKIKNEIKGLSEFQIAALKTFEQSFYDLQKESLDKLAEISETKNLKNIDLNKHLKILGLDSVFHDLYIIENNVVVNTTYLPDLGLDFSAFGSEKINLFDKIIQSQEFYAEKFQFESSTKRLKSYSYRPTPDSKFLMEIGSYSPIADKIMEMFRNRLKQIAAENENIISVNYWFGNEEYQIQLIDEALNRYIPDSLITKTFNNKTDYSTEINIGEQEILIELLFIEQVAGTRLPDFGISIITDQTNKNKPIVKIITRQIAFTFIFLILIIGLIYLATRKLQDKV